MSKCPRFKLHITTPEVSKVRRDKARDDKVRDDGVCDRQHTQRNRKRNRYSTTRASSGIRNCLFFANDSVRHSVAKEPCPRVDLFPDEPILLQRFSFPSFFLLAALPNNVRVFCKHLREGRRLTATPDSIGTRRMFFHLAADAVFRSNAYANMPMTCWKTKEKERIDASTAACTGTSFVRPWYITKETSARDKRNRYQYQIMYRTKQKENNYASLFNNRVKRNRPN